MKKSPGEIKQEILNKLERGPLSIQQLSQEIESNWLTVNKFLNELKQEKKVKEIFLKGNLRLFRLVREDTYLDIPITEEEKKTFYFLFDNAKKTFKELGKENPTKTDIQKSVVSIIDKFNLNVPAVWYLFGRMTLMKYEPEKDYSTDFKPKNYTEILDFLRKIVVENIKRVYSKNIRKAQYALYNQDLYQKKEEIYNLVLNKNLDEEKEKLKYLLSEFFVLVPSDEDSTEINSVLFDFVLLFGKMTYLKNINMCRKDILETFDAIWKMVAIHMFFESLTKYYRFKNKEEIKSLYFEYPINNKISIAQDLISNLNEKYLEKIEEIEEPFTLSDTPQTRLMRELVFGMVTEGIKEDEQVS